MSRLTRHDVVVAAGRLFASQGYHATSMRDLGRELGILGGSVYAHVGSKEELLVAVVRRAGELFGESAERALSASDNPRDRLQALIAGHIDVVLDHRDEVQTFLNEARSVPASARRTIVEERDRYEDIFKSTIKDGTAVGAFRAGTDSALAARFVLSVINAIDRWYDPKGDLNRLQLVAAVFAFVTEGLERP